MLLLSLPFASDASAQASSLNNSAKNAIKNKEWTNLLSINQQSNIPHFKNIMTWVYLTKSKAPINFYTARHFIRSHSNWPHMNTIKLKAEKSIPSSLKPYEVIEFFTENPPKTYDGINLYIKNIKQFGYNKKVSGIIKNFWKNNNLSISQTTKFIKRYKSYLSKQDYISRIDDLIWSSKYKHAHAILPFLPHDYQALSMARLILAEQKNGADAAIKIVPKHLKSHSGLLYERLRWRRKRDFNKGAHDILFNMPSKITHSKKWWLERHIMLRRAIEDKKYNLAYKLASQHKQTEGLPYAQAEWISGWLSLQFLNKPQISSIHFYNMYSHVKTPVSLSRGAYWLGRSSDALNQTSNAQDWYKKSAQYTPTFYGQHAHKKIPHAQKIKTFYTKVPTKQQTQVFYTKELVRVILTLHKMDLNHKITAPFFYKLTANAKTDIDYILIAQLAKKIGSTHQTIRTAKKLFSKHNKVLPISYPVMKDLNSRSIPPALIHSLIRQESMFNANAISPVGARGLMQLMPGTAKDMAKKSKQRYNRQKLTLDPYYNISLGTTYVQYLLDRYDGSHVLTIAAYNAGPGRVSQWIKKFGDPRKSHVNTIDWIETIPVYETRNYVQRVLEGYKIYKNLL